MFPQHASQSTRVYSVTHVYDKRSKMKHSWDSGCDRKVYKPSETITVDTSIVRNVSELDWVGEKQ